MKRVKITNKELEIILEKYAKENLGRYGTDEEMLIDLKANVGVWAKNKGKSASAKKKNASFLSSR